MYLNKILDISLWHIKDYNFTVAKMLILFGFWILVWIILMLLKKAIFKYPRIQEAKRYSIYSLFKYFTIFFAIIISLQIIGFNTTLLLAGSTALLVGLGMGIQNLFSDYISGLILLLDSSIKVDDVLDIEGLVCKVLEINLRTTQVITREDKYIVVPNTDLTRKHIINWTHGKVDSRFDVSVGVDYGSDVYKVKKLMTECALAHPKVAKKPAPFVRFNNFGDSSLDFTLYFWTENVFRVPNIQSELRFAICDSFRANNISIPFPQRVLHIPQNEKI